MTTPGRKPISDLQRELLSAYLDNQLGGVERAALERSLAGDMALRAELEELRAVRQLLRDLPAVTPPRSFTISAEQARPRRLPLFGWLRMGSALATVLLMLTFLPALLMGGGSAAPGADGALPPSGGDSTASQAMQAAPTLAAAAGAAEAPSFKATTAPASEAAPMMSAAEPTAAAASGEAAPMADAEPTAAAANREASTPTPAAVASGQATDIATNTNPNSNYGPAPADQGALVQSTRTAMDAGDAAVSDPQNSSPGTGQLDARPAVPGRPLSPLIWAQIALAVLAVSLGVGALLARRAGR